MDRAIRWYTDVLGMEFIWHSEDEDLAQMNLPSGQMVFLRETSHDTTATFSYNYKPHGVIGFQTDDIYKLYGHLKKHDVQVEEIHEDGEGNAFLDFYDLDGNLFNVQCDVKVGEG
jgi:catechol 2,3-dioxygenase-like lactoylglutathione lyase family enzyme